MYEFPTLRGLFTPDKKESENKLLIFCKNLGKNVINVVNEL